MFSTFPFTEINVCMYVCKYMMEKDPTNCFSISLGSTGVTEIGAYVGNLDMLVVQQSWV